MRDAVRIQGGVVSEIPVMELLIKSVQLAHTKYKRRINDEAVEEQVIKIARLLKETERK